MITISWYNLIAIIVFLIMIACIALIPKEGSGPAGGLGLVFGCLIWFIIFALFLAIWGGIFWW